MTCLLWNTHTHTHMHARAHTKKHTHTELPLNRITAIKGELVSPHQHTHTHSTSHNGSLGRLIRNVRESVCMCLCIYMCVWKSLMARIRLLTLWAKNETGQKHTQTYRHPHSKETLPLRLNLTPPPTTFLKDCKLYSHAIDTWGQKSYKTNDWLQEQPTISTVSVKIHPEILLLQIFPFMKQT